MRAHRPAGDPPGRVRPGVRPVTVIAVTGTPGCGKTTLCGLLATQGWSLTTVEAIAAEHGQVVGFDADDDASIVDTDALWEPLDLRYGGPDAPDRLVIDGHLSHQLPVDEIWVVRCDPDIVERRLEARGYHPGKVAENGEAEAMDLVLMESLDNGARVVQRDGTRRSPEELLSAFAESGPAPSKDHDIEAVDWSERLLR